MRQKGHRLSSGVGFEISGIGMALMFAAGSAVANEGMWMPSQLPRIANELQTAGLQLDPARFSQLTQFPMNAIISLGGCSASFVSPRGLVVTNHHCAHGSIQYQSTTQKNLLRDGFLARSGGEELPAEPGTRVYVTTEVRNVTDLVIGANNDKLTGKRRSDVIEDGEKALVAQCEEDVGYRCTVARFYGGMEFHLIKQLEIRDVRLVYAPPEGVGKFGGDTDNWMWPRHTGDFSFLRAYVGKDGKPAAFNAENVPYAPAGWLQLASQGLQAGDFVMVAGFPGRTHRHRLPAEVDFTFRWLYPRIIEVSGDQLAIIKRETQGREEAALAYASTVAGINNRYKNTQGKLASYPDSGLLERKQQELTALKNWVHADAARARRYAADLNALDALIAETNEIVQRELLLSFATPRLLNSARMLFRQAQEKTKADDRARDPGYQQRDWPRIRQALEGFDKRYDEQVDQALVRHFLIQYLALPAAQRSAAFLGALGVKAGWSEAQIDAQLERLYSGSSLADKDRRLAWLERDPAAFASSDDAFIRAAVALYADDLKREARDQELAGKLQRAYAGYMQALIEYNESRGIPVYPDANGTLRVSFGKVAGRSAGNVDGMAWAPFTTLSGIAAKHRGEGEFDAPEAQLAAIQARHFAQYADPALGSVPVNYLATLDITGGNSGSPILNSRAELVGLAFDGTFDSVISDWSFNPVTSRTIAVDLRYMLWQMAVVDGAGSLIEEMRTGERESNGS